jgi:hypothetical protein
MSETVLICQYNSSQQGFTIDITNESMIKYFESFFIDIYSSIFTQLNIKSESPPINKK